MANAWKQIDVQLKRRHDLIPKLVNTVKGAMEFERCTLEAVNFRDSSARLQASGYRLVGVSPDTEQRLAQFASDEQLDYPLLADPDHAVLDAWGAWGEKTLYGRLITGVIRSTVVVDATGHVALAQYNVKATGHVERLLRDLGVA